MRLHVTFACVGFLGCSSVSVPTEYADVVPTAGLETAVVGEGNPALGDPPSLMLWYDDAHGFPALRDAFAERLGRVPDGQLLLDCADATGFDLAVVVAPRRVTLVSGDAVRGFVRVIRSDLTEVSGPSSGCKLAPAAKDFCDPAQSSETECHFKR